MRREFDRRTQPGRRPSPADEAAQPLGGASAGLEGQPQGLGAVEIPVDSLSAPEGEAATLGAAAMAEPSAAQGDYLQRALSYVREVDGAVLGAASFGAAPAAEFAPDPNIQATSSGARAVHVQQLYQGVPIFQANQSVQFDPQGAIQGRVGQAVSITGAGQATPRLRPEEALLIAARYVAEDAEPATDQFGQPLRPPALDLASYTPQVTTVMHDRADRPTVFAQGPFGAAPRAALIWFVLDGALRLTWEILLTMPDFSGQFRVLVGAESGDLLYCHETVHYIAARGNVYTRDGDSARRLLDFPLPVEHYQLPPPADMPPGFPGDWADSAIADGNNVYAHMDDDGPTVGGRLQDGVVVFDPANAFGNAQRVLNLFYYVNFAHDYFYLLGFREPDGNFQRRSQMVGGVPGDAVDARVYDGYVYGTASMLTLTDGASPVMRMGLHGRTGRHSALDASVIYHEYAHGVTNRLIGGPLNVRAMEAAQSQALGEGLSDFFACVVTASTVVGAWLTGNPGGIRSAPYDRHYPFSYAQLGQGRFSEIHAAGEIWCAALMELSREIGAAPCAQLVMDALRLMPANPTFLQARNAVVRAIDHWRSAGMVSAERHSALHDAAWQAFTRYGMGPKASGPSAIFLGGVRADGGAETLEDDHEDDLTQIAGIDARAQRKLRGAGMRSFAALAASTPAHLARVIARSGINADFIARSRWIEIAAELAQQRPISADADTPDVTAEPEQAAPEAEPELPSEHNERQRPTSFTVRLNLGAHNNVLKTEVTDNRRDGAHDEWGGWNERRLIDFILAQAGVATPTPAAVTRRLAPEAAALAPGTADAPDVSDEEEIDMHFDGQVVKQRQGDDQLQVQLYLQAEPQLAYAAYTWKIIAVEQKSGEHIELGSQSGRLSNDQREHQLETIVGVPPEGRYRLRSLLSFQEYELFLEAAGPQLTVEK